jgi:hypothetical protein
MQILSKAIFISGTAQNVGKTTLACQLIQQNKAENWIAIKISPHKHPFSNGTNFIYSSDDFTLIEEISFTSSKDSSRMLNAGASRSFFVVCEDRFISSAITFLGNLVDLQQTLIVESAAIRRYFMPRNFILVYNDLNPSSKAYNLDLEALADHRIRFDGTDFYQGDFLFLKSQ